MIKAFEIIKRLLPIQVEKLRKPQEIIWETNLKMLHVNAKATKNWSTRFYTLYVFEMDTVCIYQELALN